MHNYTKELNFAEKFYILDGDYFFKSNTMLNEKKYVYHILA